MLELSWNGKEPLTLSEGQSRTFIDDHDVVKMTGYCMGKGFTVGFGECVGEILPS
jgi:fumarylacetoacetase